MIAALTMTIQPALASHSVPPTPVYWDCNNDLVADDGCVRIYKAGAGWGGAFDSRFQDSANQWINSTRWDPITSSTGQPVYKDDRTACGFSWTYLDANGVLGVNCRSTTWNTEGDFYKIGSTKTYLNPYLNWWTSITEPPSDRADFQGTLTHEIGHMIFLDDLECAPSHTMCGEPVSAYDVYQQRTLTTDDINAANAVYP